MNKRGLSPLIATLILIGFAIALGSVILKLGSNISTTATQLGECRSFDVLQIDARTSTEKVCFNEYLTMSKNLNQETVNGLDITYDDENKYIIQVK